MSCHHIHRCDLSFLNFLFIYFLLLSLLLNYIILKLEPWLHDLIARTHQINCAYLSTIIDLEF